jgi:hypothetical protein
MGAQSGNNARGTHGNVTSVPRSSK